MLMATDMAIEKIVSKILYLPLYFIIHSISIGSSLIDDQDLRPMDLEAEQQALKEE